MRHTLIASVATVAIAFGLALTTVGVSQALPHEFGGVGSRLTVAGDLWASGSAVSPPLVLLTAVGILAAISMRPTRGGARAASWLAVLATIGIVAGLMEPAQQQIVLFANHDFMLTLTLYASYVAWIALVIASVVRARAGGPEVGAAGADAEAIGWSEIEVTLPAGPAGA
ncbi:MAG: hypothetical protein ACJ76W_00785 [Chloroflexota bacterium]